MGDARCARPGRRDGQSVINTQLVDEADIVFVLFVATLGGATSREVSGTVEELKRSRDAGKPVHVYFSTMSLARDHDRSQLAALDEFKDSMRSMGLYGSFASEQALRDQVLKAVEFDVEAHAGQHRDAGSRRVAGARLVAEYRYRTEPSSNAKGRVRMRRTGERLVVVNNGDVLASRCA